MKRKFITNLIILLSLNLLIKPFWVLGIDRAVQNHVGVEQYGFYFAIFNFSFLLNIILDFGITNFNNKNIAQNNHLLRKHLSSIIILKLLLAVVYLIITIGFAFLVDYSAKQIILLLILAFNQFLISFVLYLRSNLSGLHMFKTDSVVSILDRLIMIILCSVLLWGGLAIEFTIELYVFAQTFAYLLTAFITLIIVFNKAKSKFWKLNWSLPFSLMIVKQSFPFAILVLLMTFYNRIDTVMMERMLTKEVDVKTEVVSKDPNKKKLVIRKKDQRKHTEGEVQAGIYASAYRLLDATNMIAYLFAALLLPIFAKMLKLRESVEGLVRLSYSILFVPAIVIAAGCYFYRVELITLMYNDPTPEAFTVFGLLMSCFVPIATTYIFGTLLTANGNLKYLNIIAGSGMLLNIILNIIFIPQFKAIGSAWASLATQLITSLIQVIMVQVIFKFKVNVRFLLALVAYIIGVICINYYCKAHFAPEKWMLSFVLMIISCAVLSVILNIFNIKPIIGMIKKNSSKFGN